MITYGANDGDITRDAARLVDKVLKGASAGDIPVERPTRIALIINLGIAKTLGLTIPPWVLARADKLMQ